MKKLTLLLVSLFSQVAFATFFGSGLKQSGTLTLTDVPGASGSWGDCASLDLSSGDWEVSGIMYFTDNGAVVAGDAYAGLSTTSGNSSSGLTLGDNMVILTAQALFTENTLDQSASIPGHKLHLTSSGTVYLKEKFTYSVATPQETCRISARRVK